MDSRQAVDSSAIKRKYHIVKCLHRAADSNTYKNLIRNVQGKDL